MIWFDIIHDCWGKYYLFIIAHRLDSVAVAPPNNDLMVKSRITLLFGDINGDFVELKKQIKYVIGVFELTP